LGLGSLTLSAIIQQNGEYFLALSVAMLSLAAFLTFRRYSDCSRGQRVLFISASLSSIALIVYALVIK
jgi:hypothetical protein